MDDRVVGVFLDDEPQGEGTLVCDVGSTPRWNGIPVRVVVMHYDWQNEGEYFFFLYRDTNLALMLH